MLGDCHGKVPVGKLLMLIHSAVCVESLSPCLREGMETWAKGLSSGWERKKDIPDREEEGNKGRIEVGGLRGPRKGTDQGLLWAPSPGSRTLGEAPSKKYLLAGINGFHQWPPPSIL